MKVRSTDRNRMRGDFRLRVYRRGRLVETFEDHNLIVDGARAQMARLVAGVTANRKIALVALGTSGEAAAADDEAITNPFTKAVTGFSFPGEEGFDDTGLGEYETFGNGAAQFHWSIGEDEANGMAIMEFGLLCQDGTLFARRVRESALNKEQDFSLEGDWTIIF